MAHIFLPGPMITRPSVREALRAQLRPLSKNSPRDARKIVLLHGERGSGRSSVLNSLRAELDGETAVAWLDAADPQYRGVAAKLTVLAEQLAGRAKGRKRLSFPRLLVGLAALRAGEDARSESGILGGEQIEKALARMRRVSGSGRVVAETIGGVELRVDLGVVAMEGVKLPIVSIGGMVKRAALRPFVEWYAESAGSEKGNGTGVLAELVRDDRDSSGRDMDVALCEAFLADLHHSRRGRERHPAPVVLLDNADAVDPDEPAEAGTSPRTAGRSFLRLLRDSRPIRSEGAGTNEYVLPMAMVATARRPRPDHPQHRGRHLHRDVARGLRRAVRGPPAPQRAGVHLLLGVEARSFRSGRQHPAHPSRPVKTGKTRRSSPIRPHDRVGGG